ncbi:MAG: hypothetical protein ABIQ52_16630 [Vicinamibacterales bacterium]
MFVGRKPYQPRANERTPFKVKRLLDGIEPALFPWTRGTLRPVDRRACDRHLDRQRINDALRQAVAAERGAQRLVTIDHALECDSK